VVEEILRESLYAVASEVECHDIGEITVSTQIFREGEFRDAVVRQVDGAHLYPCKRTEKVRDMVEPVVGK